MKKGLITLIILGVLAFVVYQWAVGFNNTAVEFEADAKTAWSNVEKRLSAQERPHRQFGEKQFREPPILNAAH